MGCKPAWSAVTLPAAEPYSEMEQDMNGKLYISASIKSKLSSLLSILVKKYKTAVNWKLSRTFKVFLRPKGLWGFVDMAQYSWNIFRDLLNHRLITRKTNAITHLHSAEPIVMTAIRHLTRCMHNLLLGNLFRTHLSLLLQKELKRQATAENQMQLNNCIL